MKNRYRINGHPFLQSASIQSVEIAELESLVRQFEAKLADPDDQDDKKWTARWLSRFRKELAKKEAGRDLKQHEQRATRRPTRSSE